MGGGGMRDGEERDERGRSALFRAAEEGNFSLVAEQVAKGASLEERDSWARITPLAVASARGHEECVRVLLSAGAVVDARSGEGGQMSSPLHMAAGEGHLQVTLLLIQHGADVNLRDRTGETPLLKASRSRKGESCALALLENSAEVNVKRWYGGTALHDAACWCWLEVVRELINKGADPSEKSGDGYTAAPYCKGRWARNPLAFTGVSKERKKAVVDVLTKAFDDQAAAIALANALWSNRRLMVMLQTRHSGGESLRGSDAGPLNPEEERLREAVLWSVERSSHEMHHLFRLIVRFL
ncbi:unnamed protein product [Chrysoparadoxa australica]